MPDLERATQYTDNKELVPTIYSGRRDLALNWFPTPGIARPIIETISSFTGGTGPTVVRSELLSLPDPKQPSDPSTILATNEWQLLADSLEGVRSVGAMRRCAK